MFRQNDGKSSKPKKPDGNQPTITDFFKPRDGNKAKTVSSSSLTEKRDWKSVYSTNENVIDLTSNFGSEKSFGKPSDVLTQKPSFSPYFSSQFQETKVQSVTSSQQSAFNPNSFRSTSQSSSTYSSSYSIGKGGYKGRNDYKSKLNNGIYIIPKAGTKQSSVDSLFGKVEQSAMKIQRTSSQSSYRSFTSNGGNQFNMLNTSGSQASQSSQSGRKSKLESLSVAQKEVVKTIFDDNKNVFFTGAAGTGKSYLLRYIIDEISLKYDGDRLFDVLAITASTGIAAFNIGGTTIHNFSGIGLGRDPVEALVKKIIRNKKCHARWSTLRYLIVDEISMLDAELFVKLDQIGRTIRKSYHPFGGIRLILTGDFFQLPPITREGFTTFCFQAKNWDTCVSRTIVLTQIFRQKDDKFATILNEARVGTLSSGAIETFKSLARPLRFKNDGIEATELYSTRYEVDNANSRRLNALPGHVVEYNAIDGGTVPTIANNMDSYSMLPKCLKLKVNAQVMLLKNMTSIDKSLVNGSLGIVIGFGKPEPKSEQNKNSKIQNHHLYDNQGNLREVPIVRFSSGYVLTVGPELQKHEVKDVTLGSRMQIPLLLAWSLSIHKAQGQTLERVRVDLGKVFEKGQAYVALSRATSLEGLQVLNFNASKVLAHPTVTEFYNQVVFKKSPI